MANRNQLISSIWSYHLSKILPKGTQVTVPLTNGLKIHLRSRTADRMIFKEIFLQEIYNQYGIEIKERDIVIDIGANVGMFTLYASQKATSGKVFAFEPFEENFRLLTNQISTNKLKNVFAFKKGVFNKEGTQDLFLSGINTGGHSIQFEQEGGKVTIDVTTLSKFCADNNIDHIDFLKIDCEGSEFEILKSDPSILQKVSKLVMECHPYGNETVDGMMELLESNGFKVIREACNHENIEMLYASKKIN